MSHPSPETRDTGRRRLTEEQADELAARYDCLECMDERGSSSWLWDFRAGKVTRTVLPCEACAPGCTRCGAEHSVCWQPGEGESCVDCGSLTCVSCGEATIFVIDEDGEPMCFVCATEELR